MGLPVTSTLLKAGVLDNVDSVADVKSIGNRGLAGAITIIDNGLTKKWADLEFERNEAELLLVADSIDESSKIDPEPQIDFSIGFKEWLDLKKKEYFIAICKRHNGVIYKAGIEAKLHERTMRRYLRDLGIFRQIRITTIE